MREEFRRCRYYPHCDIHQGKRAPYTFITNKQIEQMREMRKQGETVPSIMAKLGIAEGSVRKYIKGIKPEVHTDGTPITPEIAAKIIELVGKGLYYTTVRRMTGVNESTIYKIVHGKHYTQRTGNDSLRQPE